MKFSVKDIEDMVKNEYVENYESDIEYRVGEEACNGIESRGDEGKYKAIEPHFTKGGDKERSEFSILVSHSIKGFINHK